MIEVIVQRSSVNIEALDAALRSALPSVVSGISVRTGQVIVNLLDGATSTQVENARVLVTSHDPTVLSPRQQMELTRRQKLDQARRNYRAPEMDVATYSSQPAIIQRLAEKIAWLEQEIAELRGGAN